MLTGKKVLVIGLARSGNAAVHLLQKLNATITINEGKNKEDIKEYDEYVSQGIEMVTGGHPDELFERDFDFVIKNPGINYHKPFILRLKERHIPVYTEIELAYQVAKKQHYIAVTGTNGKTTTVTLRCDSLNIEKEFGITHADKLLRMQNNGGWYLPANSSFKFDKENGFINRSNKKRDNGTSEKRNDIESNNPAKPD